MQTKHRDELGSVDCYDAGLLNDFGGGDVEWWQDYIRAELARAHEHYSQQHADRAAELDRRNAELVEALTNVCTVLREGSPAIVDTVWVPDGTAETLLDHCEAALDHSAQEKADASEQA